MIPQSTCPSTCHLRQELLRGAPQASTCAQKTRATEAASQKRHQTEVPSYQHSLKTATPNTAATTSHPQLPASRYPARTGIQPDQYRRHSIQATNHNHIMHQSSAATTAIATPALQSATTTAPRYNKRMTSPPDPSIRGRTPGEVSDHQSKKKTISQYDQHLDLYPPTAPTLFETARTTMCHPSPRETAHLAIKGVRLTLTTQRLSGNSVCLTSSSGALSSEWGVAAH